MTDSDIFEMSSMDDYFLLRTTRDNLLVSQIDKTLLSRLKVIYVLFDLYECLSRLGSDIFKVS